MASVAVATRTAERAEPRLAAREWTMSEEVRALADSLGRGEVPSPVDKHLISRLTDELNRPLDPNRLTDLAELIEIPTPKQLAGSDGPLEVEKYVEAVRQLRLAVGSQFEPELLSVYQSACAVQLFGTNSPALSRVKNAALALLIVLDRDVHFKNAVSQALSADSPIASLEAGPALALISGSGSKAAHWYSSQIYDAWKHSPESAQLWLRTEAAHFTPTEPPQPDKPIYHYVECLMNRGAFRNESSANSSVNNPEPIRAVVLGFCENLAMFHHQSGAGYRWVAAIAATLAHNFPEVAGEVIDAFSDYPRLDRSRREIVRQELTGLTRFSGLPKPVTSAVNRILKQDID